MRRRWRFREQERSGLGPEGGGLFLPLTLPQMKVGVLVCGDALGEVGLLRK